MNSVSFKFFTAAAGVVVSACMANAADLRPVYKSRPLVPVAYNWTGFYAGVHAGYGWSQAKGLYDQSDVAGPTDLSNLKQKGAVLGGQLGYNWQISNFVVGAEIDASWASHKDTVLSPEPPARGPDPVTAQRNYLASLRARLGYAFDRTLVYGTAGVGRTTHKVTITEVLTGQTGSGNVSKTGAVYGFGVEQALLSDWTVRLEYLRYQVGTTHVLSTATFSDADPGDSIKFGNVDVVRVGVNRRF